MTDYRSIPNEELTEIARRAKRYGLVPLIVPLVDEIRRLREALVSLYDVQGYLACRNEFGAPELCRAAMMEAARCLGIT